jgi:hypothetical protein
MFGWIVLGMSMLVLVTTLVRRLSEVTPKPHQTLYPEGYMKDEVEALQRNRK